MPHCVITETFLLQQMLLNTYLLFWSLCNGRVIPANLGALVFFILFKPSPATVKSLSYKFQRVTAEIYVKMTPYRAQIQRTPC